MNEQMTAMTLTDGTQIMVPNNAPALRMMLANGMLLSGNTPQGAMAPSRLVFAADGGAVNPNSYQGNLTTEALLGTGCTDAGHMTCDRSRPVQGVITVNAHEIFQIDYPVIGVIGQLRAVTENLYSRGKSIATPTRLINGISNSIAEFALDDPASPWDGIFPWSQFARLDWSVQAQTWQPFDMNIRTVNWVGEDGQSLDRQLTIRVTNTNGGSVYIPWAQRKSPPMAMAMNQLAKPLPQVEGAFVSNIEVFDIPASIVPTFAAQVSFGTAFTPQVAAFAQLIGLYGNKPTMMTASA